MDSCPDRFHKLRCQYRPGSHRYEQQNSIARIDITFLSNTDAVSQLWYSIRGGIDLR